MPASSKFGRQPFLDVLNRRKITYREAAAEMDVPYLQVRNAGYGYVTARQELRTALVELLGMPIEELLTPESLATVPAPWRRRRDWTGRPRAKAS